MSVLTSMKQPMPVQPTWWKSNSIIRRTTFCMKNCHDETITTEPAVGQFFGTLKLHYLRKKCLVQLTVWIYWISVAQHFIILLIRTIILLMYCQDYQLFYKLYGEPPELYVSSARSAFAFKWRDTEEALHKTITTSADDVKTRPKEVVGSPLVTVAGCDGCRGCLNPDLRRRSHI